MLCASRIFRHSIILQSSSQLLWNGPSSLVWHRKSLRLFSFAKIVESAPAVSRPYLRLMRADKPTGFWLLYWPCTWSLSIAPPPTVPPDPALMALFAAGAFMMRSAGCVINDLWDKNIDAKVHRTKTRPLASGELSKRQAMGLLTGLLSSSLMILLQLNWTSVMLGASSLALVVLYPLAKRYTHWAQAFLGLTFNWGVLLGYTAATETFNPGVCLPLYAAGICWTLIYDTIYAHQDKSDDLLAGMKSTAILFADQTKCWLGGFSLLLVGCLAVAGQNADLSWPYFFSIAGIATMLTHQVLTLKTENADDCWRKFRAHQWLGALIFAGILLSKLTNAVNQAELNVSYWCEEEIKREINKKREQKRD